SLGAVETSLVVAVISRKPAEVFREIPAQIFPEVATAITATLHDRSLIQARPCFPIWVEVPRARAAAAGHQVPVEGNPARDHQQAVAQLSYHRLISRTAGRELDLHNFPTVEASLVEDNQEHAPHNVQVEATPVIFSASPAVSDPVPHWPEQCRIDPVNFQRIVSARVNALRVRNSVPIG